MISPDRDAFPQNEQEVEAMRLAGRLAAQTLEMIAEQVRPGIDTEALDAMCHKYIVEELDAVPAPLNYRGFPKSICTSINQVVCHGIPSRSEKLHKGDIINIDVTVIKDGWHGDSSVMCLVGECRPHAERLVQVARECLWLGIEAVKPGVRLGDIGYLIQNHAEAHGYSSVRDYCGHGIGRIFHTDPQIFHYGVPDSGPVIEEGWCFTIEPMINAGSHHVQQLADGWTVKTRDRRLSAQWEHTLLVTALGCEVLTLRTHESPP
ncbi:MAG: type I methionyl aminopeptidase [Gammaproteobacteria bacterium]